MSKISLSGPATGTATFTITTPAGTSTDRTVTLPDAAGTIQVSGNPISGTTGTFTGLVDISAAGAGQIQFPATQNASANANTLDDYEEGTFTLTPFTSGYTSSINAGVYTKVGRVVTIQYSVSFSAVGAQNSGVIFSGLPFAAINYQSGSCQSGMCRENSATGAIYVVNTQSGSTSFEINSMDGVGAGQQRTIRVNEVYSCTLTYFTS